MVERNAACSSAWQALHLSLSFSSGCIAAHHANFWAGAVAKLQLILRRLPILARRGRLCT